MANWSQSHFLQSLGWATLNSFWQMALLWCLYLCANSLFQLSAHKKYKLSVLAVMTGFAWFIFSFIYFFRAETVSSIALFNQSLQTPNSILNVFLLSASITYLGLLFFPSYRLFRNWQFVRRIKREGIKKADLGYRLFVQKIACQLGISQKVFVFVSELVKSPVTIGFIKPVILLPIAALNNLSTQQVEAILLHELSHIRRADYLVNLVVSIISTILYFNPFVRQFIRNIEQERENCCDQLVLQYGYDKVGYASALLTLEKLNLGQSVLALGATGKNYLLSRIEKIIGMEKKKGFKANQFAGILAALFCIVVFNSILIIKEKKKGADYSFAYDNLNNLFNSFDGAGRNSLHTITPVPAQKQNALVASAQTATNQHLVPSVPKTASSEDVRAAQPEMEFQLTNVAFDEVEGSLTSEQKEKVKSTVAATKKVLTNLQWKVVENNIADAMSDQEKETAKKEYLKAIDHSVNWQNVEQNMKAQYEKINWNKLNSNIDRAMTVIALDSLQKNYTAILTQLNKTNSDACTEEKVSATPLPDQSMDEIKKSSEVIKQRVETIRALRSPKKIVRL
ncbi:MAG: M56 family metallopeptidase [Flavisolibacter sp.]